jgi:hypothetical protein
LIAIAFATNTKKKKQKKKTKKNKQTNIQKQEKTKRIGGGEDQKKMSDHQPTNQPTNQRTQLHTHRVPTKEFINIQKKIYFFFSICITSPATAAPCAEPDPHGPHLGL